MNDRLLIEALKAYRDKVNQLPKTFPVRADANGFRPEHVEGMRAALAVALDKAAAFQKHATGEE